MKLSIEGIHIRSLFGNNVKRLRDLHNMSQMGLADRADLTHTFINDIENGKKWISGETLAKLAIALQAEPYQFFLPETASPDSGDNFFGVYLDDFSDNVQRMVGELKSRYLQDQDKED